MDEVFARMVGATALNSDFFILYNGMFGSFAEAGTLEGKEPCEGNWVQLVLSHCLGLSGSEWMGFTADQLEVKAIASYFYSIQTQVHIISHKSKRKMFTTLKACYFLMQSMLKQLQRFSYAYDPIEIIGVQNFLDFVSFSTLK